MISAHRVFGNNSGKRIPGPALCYLAMVMSKGTYWGRESRVKLPSQEGGEQRKYTEGADGGGSEGVEEESGTVEADDPGRNRQQGVIGRRKGGGKMTTGTESEVARVLATWLFDIRFPSAA